MLNNFTVMGRLVATPELKLTPSGTSVCRFRIACDRNFKNSKGEYETDFFTCTAWRHAAESVTYSFTDVPQSVLDDWQKVLKTSLALNQWKNGRQVISFVDQKHQEWYAPDIFTLELDGVLYEPHWSYWLERVYYIADDKIRELAQVK